MAGMRGSAALGAPALLLRRGGLTIPIAPAAPATAAPPVAGSPRGAAGLFPGRRRAVSGRRIGRMTGRHLFGHGMHPAYICRLVVGRARSVFPVNGVPDRAGSAFVSQWLRPFPKGGQEQAPDGVTGEKVSRYAFPGQARERWPRRSIIFILRSMDDRTIPQNPSPSWPALAAALCLLSGSLIVVDAALVEPDEVEVEHSLEYVPVWRSAAPDLTLVHLSDIHVERLGARERRAIDAVNTARPDLIVISGDLVRTGSHPEGLREFLSALRARRGRFVVFGNHDHDSGIAESWGPEVVAQSGFTLLENASQRVTTPSGTILIAGIDDPVTGHDSLKRAMAAVSRRDLSILVTHSPEIVGDLGHWDIDLVLAGHTHGGQVRLPILGAPLLPAGTRPYVEGWFDVGGGARLHVSRGLGWCGLPIRFLCRPRVDVITLRGGAVPRGRARIATGPA